MSPSAAALTAAVVLLSLGAGCRSDKAPPPRPSAAPSAPPSARPKKASSASVRPPVVPVGCRVLSVKPGKAPLAASVPRVGDRLDGGSIDLPDGAELSLRHSETRREFTLRGEGRFRVCPNGDETVLVARGSMTTTSGPGARAGAEVHLGTPFGVVHFGDAELTLTVTGTQVDLAVRQGVVAVHGRTAADRGPSTRGVAGPDGRLKLGGRTDAAVLVGECDAALRALIPPPADAGPAASAPVPLGAWAVQKLRARQGSRYTCMRAEAAVTGLDGPEAIRLGDLLTARIGTAGRETGPSEQREPFPASEPSGSKVEFR